MKFFPSENITYKTKLPANEVLKCLAKNIEPVTNNWGRIFAGSIKGNEFEMRRNINYRNSFQAQITGKVRAVNDETFVNVKMELLGVAKGLLIFFSIFASLMFVVIIYAIINSGHFTPFVLFPPGFIFMNWIFATSGFQAEFGKSKKELKKIIEGEIVK